MQVLVIANIAACIPFFWSPFWLRIMSMHAKIWLVVKEESLASAQCIFNHTSAGWAYLGAALNTPHFIRDYT